MARCLSCMVCGGCLARAPRCRSWPRSRTVAASDVALRLALASTAQMPVARRRSRREAEVRQSHGFGLLRKRLAVSSKEVVEALRVRRCATGRLG